MPTSPNKKILDDEGLDILVKAIYKNIDSKYVSKSNDGTGTGNVDDYISAHNNSSNAHEDIRKLITEIIRRLDLIANSDDINLDQLAEIVAYIKNNKSLIDQITTNKVNVSDIVNNLTTNASNKPLSAAQGVQLKKLIDDTSVDTKKYIDQQINIIKAATPLTLATVEIIE